MHKKFFKNLLLLICSFLCNFNIIFAYTQVAVSGSNTEHVDGPRIFKALNTDLIFPKTFNSSENVVSTTEAYVSSSSSSVSPTVAENTAVPTWYQPIFVTPANNVALQDKVEPVALPTPPPTPVVQTLPAPVEPTQDQSASTGRAIDHYNAYPFGQLIGPQVRKQPPPARPSNIYRQNPKPLPYARNPGSYAQPAMRRKPNRGQVKLTDRFSPSEGVAAGYFAKNHKHNHNHNHDTKVPASSNIVSSYVPPKNLYAFPPVNTNYPSPSNDPKAALPSDQVTSYLPPPSGVNGGADAGYVYPGPVLASNNDATKAADPVKGPADDGAGDSDDTGSDDSIGVLPASAMDAPAAAGAGNDAGKDMGGNGGGDDLPDLQKDQGPDDGMYDFNKEYPTPPPSWLAAHPESNIAKPADHDHHHDADPEPMPAPMPEYDHYPDHPHHEHHDHHIPFEDPHHEHDYIPPLVHDYPSYPIYHGPPSYPELIYDDHDHFHHHHHVEPPPPPPPPTTPEPPPPPPPEPAPEPRVKKYSYFYIGRKLWYVPLYFTIYFSFYVLWLILKSIARHKVNLPNHYVNRRSLPDYSTKQRDEQLNNLTVNVLEHIENFKRKYIT